MRYDPGLNVNQVDYLCLHRNENHFVVKDLEGWLSEASSVLLCRYPDSTCHDLRHALAERHGVSIDSIYVGNGSDGVLSDLMNVLLPKYDGALNLPDVGYKVYDLLANRFSAKVRRYNSRALNYDWNGLWVFDSPNAITGEMIARRDMEQIAAKPSALVIWDNCYGDYEQEIIPQFDTTHMVVVRSFSKYFGCAALRIGYCIGSTQLISELHARKDVYGVNAVAQAIAVAALSKTDMFRARADEMIAARQNIAARLTSAGFGVSASSANFLAVTHPRFGAKAVSKALQEQGILVRHFDFPEVENLLRLTIPSTDLADHLFEKLVATTRYVARCANPS